MIFQEAGIKPYAIQYRRRLYDRWELDATRTYDTLEEAQAAFAALPADRYRITEARIRIDYVPAGVKGV